MPSREQLLQGRKKGDEIRKSQKVEFKSRVNNHMRELQDNMKSLSQVNQTDETFYNE